jgi:hypothetical protein
MKFWARNGTPNLSIKKHEWTGKKNTYHFVHQESHMKLSGIPLTNVASSSENLLSVYGNM